MTEPATLFDIEPAHPPFTTVDIDQWLADIRTSGPSCHWCPNDWTRAALGELLGEDIPHRVWTSSDLTYALRRARKALTDPKAA